LSPRHGLVDPVNKAEKDADIDPKVQLANAAAVPLRLTRLSSIILTPRPSAMSSEYSDNNDHYYDDDDDMMATQEDGK
jgi:hypothetical protein